MKPPRSTFVTSAAGLATALLVAACQSTAPPPPVAAVTIVPESIEIVVGGAVQLTATMWDASGRAASGRAVTWASSNPTVGIVSATGLVTALNRGSTTVNRHVRRPARHGRRHRVCADGCVT
jgi:Big-like domain-containing protein